MADAATLSVLIQTRGAAQVNRELGNLQGSLQKMATNAGAAGRSLALMGAPFIAVAGLSIKAAVGFETGMAGVRKTVDATEKQFAALAQGFRNMAKEIPITVNELLGIGEAAGQLGIKTENILSFSRTMAELGITTNLSANDAATALARLANITQMPQDQFDRLGSVIVDLGNNLATTEAEILQFGLRIAGAGNIVGLTEAQILAIGGALSSVGVEAQAGGTAVQKVLLAMSKSIATSNSDLGVFAATAGQTADEFAKAFRDDAGLAFTAFVEGLGKSGDDAFKILEELGLQDQRLLRAFLSLANAGDTLRTSIDLGTKAWADNNALTIEAQKRIDTAASQFKLFKADLNDVAITIGQTLVPILIQLVEKVKPMVEGLGRFAEDHPKIVLAAVAIGSAVAALGVALIGVSLVLPGIIAAGPLVGAAFTMMLGPIGLVVAALAAFAAAYSTNFLHIRDITNEVVGFAIGRLNVWRDALGFAAKDADGLTESINRTTEATLELSRAQLLAHKEQDILQGIREQSALVKDLGDQLKHTLDESGATDFAGKLALQLGEAQRSLQIFRDQLDGIDEDMKALVIGGAPPSVGPSPNVGGTGALSINTTPLIDDLITVAAQAAKTKFQILDISQAIGLNFQQVREDLTATAARQGLELSVLVASTLAGLQQMATAATDTVQKVFGDMMGQSLTPMFEGIINLAQDMGKSIAFVEAQMRDEIRFTGDTWQEVLQRMGERWDALQVKTSGTTDRRTAFNNLIAGAQAASGGRLFNFEPPAAASGGLVKVGEHGTEIVRLPDQSQIFPAGSELGGMQLHIHMEGASFIGNLPEDVAATIAEAVSERIGVETSIAERLPQG